MTEKFTQGEWEVKSRYTEWESTEKKIYSTQVIAPAAGYIISSIDTKDEKLLDMMQANAALIAAAPKMYNRLKEVKSDFRALLFNPYISEHTKECIKVMIDHIEDDLKKARGEQ